MRKLAFLGVILLGLMLLATHLCVTFTLATGVALVSDIFEREADEVMGELGSSLKEAFSTLDQGESKDNPRTQRTQEEQTGPGKVPGKELGNHAKQADETAPGQANRSVPDTAEELRQLLESKTIPLETRTIVWKSEPITFRRSYSHEVPGWLVWYGIMGIVIILCGTTFLAIACLKRGSSH